MAKNEIYEVLGFREFLAKIKKEVGKEVGSDYKVDINHVVKNNSVELDSLIILKEKESITPNIYLNPFYERYRKGESINNMVEEIIHIYQDSKLKEENISVPFDLEEIKTFIIYRLVNFNRNKQLLEGIPHIRFLDLAITFHYLVKNNDDGIGTIRITNEHIKNWEIDLESLKELAKVNTPRLFPPVSKSMNDIILDIINKEMETKELVNKRINAMNHNQIQQTFDDRLIMKSRGVDSDKTNTMYVLSNSKGINGASCLIYKDTIKNLADALQADFYILPSSIHEIILVKDNGLLEKEGLKSMVSDVNRTQVPKEEILSDSVYYYSRERDAITMFH